MREETDDVGYRRPPKATRFKAGASGNPSGRPKTIKTIGAELKEALGETIRVPLGNRQVEKTKARAIVDELMRLAIGGDLRAATIITGLAERIDRDTDQSNDETPNDRALLDSFIDREIRRRATDPKTNEDSPKKDQLP